ncbi:nuclear transport factor 2 family protein [Porticoccaceae bacterium]|nr:nuclear transport factor 2 family protein [Porticoccaceae bacterium]
MSVDPQAENLEKAAYCMDILENRPDLEPSRRIDILRNECIGETYIQHTPYVEDGPGALLSLFANRYKNRPETSMSIKRAASEGDLVWLHVHVKATPEALGVAAVHIFRMKEGRFVEHWGVVQPVPEESLNDNTMF